MRVQPWYQGGVGGTMRGREARVATKAGGGKAWVRGGQCTGKGRAELSSGFLEAGVEEFSI